MVSGFKQDPESRNIIPKCRGYNKKPLVIPRMKKNLNLNEKRQSTDTNMEVTQKLKLSDDFKAAIIRMFNKQLLKHMKQMKKTKSQQRNRR